MTFYPIHSRQEIYQLPSFQDDQATISDVLKEIGRQTEITRSKKGELNRIEKDIGYFSCFNAHEMVVLYDAYTLSKNGYAFHLLIMTINSKLDRVVHRNQINRELIAEHEFVGLIRLKKDYGHTFIRPETIQDKFNELLNPIEVDFEFDKEFSCKYFVLTSNEPHLRSQVSAEFFSAIKSYQGLEIEIQGQLLLVRLRQRISMDSAIKILNFLAKIAAGMN